MKTNLEGEHTMKTTLEAIHAVKASSECETRREN